MDDFREVSQEKPFGPFNNFKHNESLVKLIGYIFISKKKVF